MPRAQLGQEESQTPSQGLQKVLRFLRVTFVPWRTAVAPGCCAERQWRCAGGTALKKGQGPGSTAEPDAYTGVYCLVNFYGMICSTAALLRNAAAATIELALWPYSIHQLRNCKASALIYLTSIAA